MADYKTDLEIAREAKKIRIANLASESLSISEENLIPFGHYKAKIGDDCLKDLESQKDGKLILVTAMMYQSSKSGSSTDNQPPKA